MKGCYGLDNIGCIGFNLLPMDVLGAQYYVYDDGTFIIWTHLGSLKYRTHLILLYTKIYLK